MRRQIGAFSLCRCEPEWFVTYDHLGNVAAMAIHETSCRHKNHLDFGLRWFWGSCGTAAEADLMARTCASESNPGYLAKRHMESREDGPFCLMSWPYFEENEKPPRGPSRARHRWCGPGPHFWT